MNIGMNDWNWILLEERAREGGGGMELEGGCELMNELIYIYIYPMENGEPASRDDLVIGN
jgi:hypothetical protein